MPRAGAGHTFGEVREQGMKLTAAGMIVIAAAALAACGGSSSTTSQQDPNPHQYGKGGSVFDSIFGEGKTNGDEYKIAAGPTGASVVGVNSYLWRATLDTVSFMPLASADPFGGVIISDWFSPPAAPGERFKLNIAILGRELRADGVRVSVFRQRRDAGGQWADAPVDAATGTDIENAILMRARQMKLSTASK
jgi:hypothetical protein